MHDHFFDDGLNPKFVFHSPVHPDELDARYMLPSSRFAAHLESAIAAWSNTSELHVVRDMRIELLSPVAGPVTMRIDLWVESLDDTSCVYGFILSSADGRTAFARGDRTILRLDPDSHRPAPWSRPFRTKHETLRKDLRAYA